MPSHNARRCYLAIVLVCALSSGCISVKPAVYGESWARQVKTRSGECPVIDGDYQNAGEGFAKAKDGSQIRNDHSLANLLNIWGDNYQEGETDSRLGSTFYDPAMDPYRTIHLQVAGDRLLVEAALADGSSRKFDLPARRRCRDSELMLKAIDGGVDYEYTRTTLRFGRAEDGSLLVHWGSFYMMSIIGPNAASYSAAWVRFPPAASASKQPTALTP